MTISTRLPGFICSAPKPRVNLLLGKLSKIGHEVSNGELSEPLVLLCNSKFKVSRSVIVLGDDDSFNVEKSSLRINIECAFGEFI